MKGIDREVDSYTWNSNYEDRYSTVLRYENDSFAPSEKGRDSVYQFNRRRLQQPRLSLINLARGGLKVIYEVRIRAHETRSHIILIRTVIIKDEDVFPIYCRRVANNSSRNNISICAWKHK